MALKTEVKRIKLAGNPSRRTDATTSAIDQLYTNCFARPLQTVDGETKIYVEKRPGLWNNGGAQPNSGVKGSNIHAGSDNYWYSAWADGSVYRNNSQIGTIDGGVGVGYITEGAIDASLTGMIIFSATGITGATPAGGIYLFNITYDETATTFTADTTSASPTLTNCTGGVFTAQEVAVGQLLSGTGIPANARVQAVDYGAGTITMGSDDATTVNATATNAGITVTREHLQKLMSANMPDTNTCPYACFMDGYIFFIDEKGRLYNTQYNDYHTLHATNYLATSLRGAQIGGIVVVKNKIMVVTEEEVGFYQNVGNPQGSVLKRVPEMTLTVPAANRSTGGYHTLHSLRNYVAIANGYNTYLYNIDTHQLEQISDDLTRQENFITTGGSNPGVRLIRYFGRDYVLVTYQDTSTARDTMCYDIKNKLWTKLDFNKTMIGASSGTQDTVYWISLNDTGGYVDRWQDRSNMVWQDYNAQSYTMTIQTARADFGTQRYKRVRRLTLIGDEQLSAASVSIQWSDDDYQNFNTARTVDMADNRGTITELGVMRRPAFKITNSSNTPLRLEAIELEFEVLER